MKMFLRVSSLLLLLPAVYAEGVDLSSYEYLIFEPYYPGGPGSTFDTLELFVLFDRSDVWDHVVNMMLFVSEPGEEELDHVLVTLNRNGVFPGSNESNFDAAGELDSPSDSVALLDLIWQNPGDGYCRSYSLRIIGEDVEGETHFVDKTIQVGAPEGSTCD